MNDHRNRCAGNARRRRSRSGAAIRLHRSAQRTPQRAQWRCVACHCNRPPRRRRQFRVPGRECGHVPRSSAKPAPLPVSDGCLCTLRSGEGANLRLVHVDRAPSRTCRPRKKKPASGVRPSRTDASSRLGQDGMGSGRETPAQHRPVSGDPVISGLPRQTGRTRGPGRKRLLQVRSHSAQNPAARSTPKTSRTTTFLRALHLYNLLPLASLGSRHCR